MKSNTQNAKIEAITEKTLVQKNEIVNSACPKV